MTNFVIKILLTTLSSLCFLPILGQETMVLKNGSILHGHTSCEIFDTRTIMFMVDSAIIVENIENVLYTEPVITPVNEIKHSSWRRWFENHPEQVFLHNGKRSVRLGNIHYLKNESDNFGGDAIILEIDRSILNS